MMTLEQSIIRVLGSNHKPVGVGFLVEQNILITCAHVVSAALGERRLENAPFPKSRPIFVDFPLLNSSHKKIRLQAEVVGWKPYTPSQAGDIACLRLNDTVPSGAIPASVRIKTDLWKHTFRAYGVPTGYDEGVWSQGQILSRQSIGYFQVQSLNTTGYAIQAGFSGSPVWSDHLQAVVGILTLADQSAGVYSAFAIPARMLIEMFQTISSAPTISSTLVAPISTLGDLITLDQAILDKLSQTTYVATTNPAADAEDLLNAALSQLICGRYDTATALLSRLLKLQPDQAYAVYAWVLSELNGKRPAAARDFNKMRSLIEALKRVSNSTTGHFLILMCYMQQDYFERNGFSAYTTDLPVHFQVAQTAQTSGAELEALARVLPDIVTFPLWRKRREAY